MLKSYFFGEEILAFIEDEKLCKRLKQAGYERLKYFEKIDRVEILSKIIKEFRSRRFCWE